MMKDDLLKTLYTEDEIKKRVAEIGAEISRDYAGKVPIVVGILKGASVFFADLIRAVDEPLQIDFMSLSSYGAGTKSSGVVTVRKDMDAKVKGRSVIICEDIVDSGRTMEFLISLLKERGAEDVAVCALLSKPSRREVPVKIDYCGWEVPDEFLVGYGLDYAEKYRNIPYIGILRPEVYS